MALWRCTMDWLMSVVLARSCGLVRFDHCGLLWAAVYSPPVRGRLRSSWKACDYIQWHRVDFLGGFTGNLDIAHLA